MFMISLRRNIVDLWFWWVLCCSFKSLQKPLDHRRAQLEVSVQLFGFYHDVDLELSWILEHVPVSGSMVYDKSLAGALSLMQKHKVPTGCQDLVQDHISCYCDSVCSPGAAGWGDSSQNIHEPHPREGAEPGQFQQIGCRWSAPEVKFLSKTVTRSEFLNLPNPLLSIFNYFI